MVPTLYDRQAIRLDIRSLGLTSIRIQVCDFKVFLRRLAEWLERCFPDWEWHNVRIFETEDPNHFWVECDGRGKALVPGYPQGYCENHYIHSFELENGRIKRTASVGAADDVAGGVVLEGAGAAVRADQSGQVAEAVVFVAGGDAARVLDLGEVVLGVVGELGLAAEIPRASVRRMTLPAASCSKVMVPLSGLTSRVRLPRPSYS